MVYSGRNMEPNVEIIQCFVMLYLKMQSLHYVWNFI